MGRPLIDISGQVFDRLTVIRQAGFTRSKEASWLCRCACGTERIVSGHNLRSGNSRSCGCFRLEGLRSTSTTHGHTRGHQFTPEYRTWAAMMGRCRNPNHERYKYYGAIGRDVYRPWHKAAVFIAYLIENLGPKPPGMTLDRIDNQRGYYPGNIRWATWKQQAANRRQRRPRISAAA